MTLPIQRPGQFAVIGDNGQAGSGWINHTTTTGSSPGITGPCGEVGMCGGGPNECGDGWDDYCNCVRNCFYDGSTGTNHNDKAWEKWRAWEHCKHVVDTYLVKIKASLARMGITITGTLTEALTGGGVSFDSVLAAIDDQEIRELFNVDLTDALKQGNMLNGELGPEKSFEVYLNAEKKCRGLCSQHIPGGSGGGSGGGMG